MSWLAEEAANLALSPGVIGLGLASVEGFCGVICRASSFYEVWAISLPSCVMNNPATAPSLRSFRNLKFWLKRSNALEFLAKAQSCLIPS